MKSYLPWPAGGVPQETIEQIKDRKYECFMEDHEPKSWTPGLCAGFAGKGSRALHLFRCKRRSGHGIGASADMKAADHEMAVAHAIERGEA